MPEARLDDFGSGLAPVTDGWFVVSLADAEWWTSERRGARCAFESEYPPGDRAPLEFPQLGVNVSVLEPGQSRLYHAESDQEAFLVLSGSASCSSRAGSGCFGRGTSSTVRPSPSTSSSVQATGRA